MVDWIHGNTASLWPRVALDSELVLSTRSLHEGLVGSATTSNDTDHSTDVAGDDLLGSRWELDAGLSLIWVVADNCDIVSGSASECSTISNLLLDVRDDGTLRDGANWEDVSDGESSLLASVDELSGVHALIGDEGLGVKLETVDIARNWTRASGAPRPGSWMMSFTIPRM